MPGGGGGMSGRAVAVFRSCRVGVAARRARAPLGPEGLAARVVVHLPPDVAGFVDDLARAHGIGRDGLIVACLRDAMAEGGEA